MIHLGLRWRRWYSPDSLFYSAIAPFNLTVTLRLPLMNTAIGRRIRTIILGFLALMLPGCADMPAWVPFQGPRTDHVPGVVTPAEKIAQLKKLSSEAANSDQQTKQRVVGQLVTSIRSETDSLIRAEIVRTLGDYPDPAADAVLKSGTERSRCRCPHRSLRGLGQTRRRPGRRSAGPNAQQRCKPRCPIGRRSGFGKNQGSSRPLPPWARL